MNQTTRHKRPGNRPAGPTVQAILDSGLVPLRLADGRLLGIFSETKEGHSRAVVRYSPDNGCTWGDSETLFNLPADAGEFALCEALLDAEGEAHLFFLHVPEGKMIEGGEAEKHVLWGEMLKSRIDIWYARSVNGRTGWQPVRPLWKGYTGSLNSVIQTRRGRIILPFSLLTSRSWSKRGGGLGEFTFVGTFDSTVIYSDDAGATWHASNCLRVPVPDISYAYGAVEPVMLELSDGRIWMLIRTQMGRFYESFSEDGAVWSRPQPTNILSSDSPAGLVRLDDGRIVLFWNNCLRYPYAYGGRQVLHAAISDDEGRTWRGGREVARDPKRNDPPPPNGDFGTAYPLPSVAHEGQVIFCTGQGKGRVLLTRLDPDWLLETTQEADFRERQEEWSVFGTRGVEFMPHPDKPGSTVLSVRKTEADWPAAAVWNFPTGARGSLRLRLCFREGCQGALVSLTDHFSPPFDEEDHFNNVFNLGIGPELVLPSGTRLSPGVWHDLEFRWDSARRVCRLRLDGHPAGTLVLLRAASSVSYLRVRCTAASTDPSGLMLESARVEVR